MSATGDRFALWLKRVTVRRLTAGELAVRREGAATALEYAALDGAGYRSARGLVDLLDAEIKRRAREADFWGAP